MPCHSGRPDRGLWTTVSSRTAPGSAWTDARVRHGLTQYLRDADEWALLPRISDLSGNSPLRAAVTRFGSAGISGPSPRGVRSS
jgi:hypothetical protein